jgi:CheY-like chemotaxis protein
MKELSRRTVLCVDDTSLPLRISSLLPEGQGYDVVRVAGVAEALDVFSTRQIDIVVSDHSVQGSEGAGLAEKMKQINPDIPFLLISDATDHLAHADSVDAFAPKSSGKKGLLAMIALMLESIERRHLEIRVSTKPMRSVGDRLIGRIYEFLLG